MYIRVFMTVSKYLKHFCTPNCVAPVAGNTFATPYLRLWIKHTQLTSEKLEKLKQYSYNSYVLLVSTYNIETITLTMQRTNLGCVFKVHWK